MKLVEAAHDENGKLSYGQAGDQTGDEVRIREISDSETFKYYFRQSNKVTAAYMAQDALDIANNNNIGYAQYSKNGTKYDARYGLWYAMKAMARVEGDLTHPSFSEITIKCNTDCSQMIGCILLNNGYQPGMYISTSTEVSILQKLGFTMSPYRKNELEAGDILWRSGHTAIVVEGAEPESEGEDLMYSAILTSSSNTKTWSTGAGPLTRALPYITVSRAQIGFKPNVICVQQQGEVLSLCQWMRDQKEGFLYVSNFENNASAGVAVGTAAGYFNPDATKLVIPVRFAEKEYIVKIYG